ncbi:MAG TPA: hypothetical protein VGM87_02270 [Roseomonas sp.]
MNAISPLLGVGVYRIPQAARLAEVPVARARAWVAGERRPADSGQSTGRARPLLGTRLSTSGPETLVSFADLIEMRFAKHFRTMGFSWPRILRHLPELRRVVLQHREPGEMSFESDGVRIFAQAVAQTGERKAVELDTRQHVMVDLLERSFREELRFDASGYIASWQPRAQYPHVIIDPNRQFGEPIVHPGVPTAILSEDLLRLGGDADRVARRYAVSPEAVIEAHRFETDLRSYA